MRALKDANRPSVHIDDKVAVSFLSFNISELGKWEV